MTPTAQRQASSSVEQAYQSRPAIVLPSIPGISLEHTLAVVQADLKGYEDLLSKYQSQLSVEPITARDEQHRLVASWRQYLQQQSSASSLLGAAAIDLHSTSTSLDLLLRHALEVRLGGRSPSARAFTKASLRVATFNSFSRCRCTSASSIIEFQTC